MIDKTLLQRSGTSFRLRDRLVHGNLDLHDDRLCQWIRNSHPSKNVKTGPCQDSGAHGDGLPGRHRPVLPAGSQLSHIQRDGEQTPLSPFLKQNFFAEQRYFMRQFMRRNKQDKKG